MEHKTFPFNPPKLPEYKETRIFRCEKFPGPEITQKITKQGVTLSERLNLYASNETIPKHTYSSDTTFGHHLPENNLHPMMNRRIPPYQTTSCDYGRHYRHPEQTYTRVLNLRNPSMNPQISMANLDRFRKETRLMPD